MNSRSQDAQNPQTVPAAVQPTASGTAAAHPAAVHPTASGTAAAHPTAVQPTTNGTAAKELESRTPSTYIPSADSSPTRTASTRTASTNPSPTRTASTKDDGAERPRGRALRVLFIVLGLLTLALGTLGVVLPLLPTTPFYLLSLFCFARGSKRLHSWFSGTRLYKRYIESYLRDRGMTVRTKLSIMLSFSLLIAISLFFMRNNLLACVILGIVWVGHSIYLFGRVRTIKEVDKGGNNEGREQNQ